MTSTHQAETSQPSHAGDNLLTTAEVADLLRVPVATLRYWRHLGTGPHSFRIGRSVRYWRTEVLYWLEEQSSRPRTPAEAHKPRRERGDESAPR